MQSARSSGQKIFAVAVMFITLVLAPTVGMAKGGGGGGGSLNIALP